jgi:hypothetical protein
MNFGTYDIEKVIWKQIDMGVEVRCKGGTKKYVKDLAKQIYKFLEENIGDDMSNKDFMLAHGVTPEMDKFIQRLERALGGYLFKRDEKSLEVYKWIMAQPEEKLKAFIVWATAPERVQFIGKYKNNPATIQFDWEQVKNTSTITRNEDGSLYV